jgi:hypothetical protein
MNKRNTMLSIVAAGLLTMTACATGTKFADLQPRTTPEIAEVGRIFFYRPSSLGAALRPSVKLNGEDVGQAISQGFFYVDRPPGQYEVVTETEVKRKVSFVLDKGQTRYIRFSASLGFFVGHVYGQLVEPDIALGEIKKCKYTGVK